MEQQEQRPSQVEEDDKQSNTSQDRERQDYWVIAGTTLTRMHVTPRRRLYVPTDEDSDIPLKFLDVTRRTHTDMDHLSESIIRDEWCTGDNDDRELSSWWTGCTKFDILRPAPPPGKMWVGPQLYDKRETTRPPWIQPSDWSDHMSKKQRQRETAKWNELRPRWDALRRKTQSHLFQ